MAYSPVTGWLVVDSWFVSLLFAALGVVSRGYIMNSQFIAFGDLTNCVPSSLLNYSCLLLVLPRSISMLYGVYTYRLT